MWILNTITPLSELYRMTQFKDKMGDIFNVAVAELARKSALRKTLEQKLSQRNLTWDEKEKDKFIEQVTADLKSDQEFKEDALRKVGNVGLFDYPVLMASDILLYDAKFVPVGDDQDQHLELTRTLARKFNTKFPILHSSKSEGGRNVFIGPKALHTATPRIMSLKNPEKKMSKSAPESCLFIDDTPNEIERKIKTAVTDSDSVVRYDREKKPGISNLMEIYSGISGDSFKKIEGDFTSKNYGEFKAKLIGLVIDHFADFRKKKKSLMAKSSIPMANLKTGSKKASLVANKKIALVKKRIGIDL
jgi:tryptophanyl-tRNA synthetase